MLDILENLKEKAGKHPYKIIFPEGEDERVIDAAKEIDKQGIAVPVLVRETSIDGIENVSPESDPKTDEFIDEYYKKNSKRCRSREEAAEIIRSPLFYAAMKLGKGDVDGFVGGAANSTAMTVRALLKCVGVDPAAGLLSSFFLMLLKQKFFLFADCAVNMSPDSGQLAVIASQTSAACRAFTGAEPKTALLSFSTLGSAKSGSVSKVARAAGILKENKADFEFIGEIQADAAIVPEIAGSKTKGRWKGDANVLIFPNLDSGNIAYKLVERLAGASAVGPVLQGLNKPGNDLSRGCSRTDIVNVAAVTAVQCSMVNNG